VLRITVDTNTLISGTIWRGKPGAIVRLIAGETVRLVTSESLLDELYSVLTRPEFLARLASQGLTPDTVLASLRKSAEVATPEMVPPTSRDPDDDAVLAVALAAKVDVIVSGDLDLRVLKDFHGIPILNAAEFLDFYAHLPH
jgi:uncharacterized protein